MKCAMRNLVLAAAAFAAAGVVSVREPAVAAGRRVTAGEAQRSRLAAPRAKRSLPRRTGAARASPSRAVRRPVSTASGTRASPRVAGFVQRAAPARAANPAATRLALTPNPADAGTSVNGYSDMSFMNFHTRDFFAQPQLNGGQ